MKRSTVAIVLLSLALVASNVWWLLKVLDAGITSTYQSVSIEDTAEALAQVRAVMPVALRENATRAEVVEAAGGAAKYKEFFEKDGYLWIGRVGLKFDGRGRLIDMTTE